MGVSVPVGVTVGVSVGRGVGVSVGGTGVKVSVGKGVKVGVGVLVGVGVIATVGVKVARRVGLAETACAWVGSGLISGSRLKGGAKVQADNVVSPPPNKANRVTNFFRQHLLNAISPLSLSNKTTK